MPFVAAKRLRARGFTLIEVMVTVAIVAILASVALPSYQNYIRRGQQPEAFNALSDFRAKMEQYYQDNRNYGTGTSMTCAPDATASAWNAFTSTARFSYLCKTDGATQQTYRITATGIGGQVTGDKYTIDQNGNRTTTVFKGVTVSQNCWLTSSSSC